MTRTRLTDEDVVEIRLRYREGARQVDLADEYGVSQKTISSIVIGRTRAAAGGPLTTGGARKLTSADVVQIRELSADGMGTAALASRFGVSAQMIQNIVTGKAFPDVGGPRRAPMWQRAKAPLTKEEVEQIKARFEAGEPRADVAAAFGISIPTLYRIKRGDIVGVDVDRGFARDEVVEMRLLFRQGISQEMLAQRFRTSQAMVSQIVRGNMYAWMPGPVAGKQRRDLTHDRVIRIREAFAAKTTIDQLAAQYGTTTEVITQLVRGITYASVPGPTFPLL